MSARKLLHLVWKHPANRDAKASSIANAISWQIWKRLTGRSRVLNLYNGIQFTVYPDSTAASAVLYFNGLPDYDEMQFMAHYLRPGDGFLDIGANIGTYTLYAASLVGLSGRIDAFEPGTKALTRLRQQVGNNNLTNVHVWPNALCDSEAILPFSDASDTTNHIAAESVTVTQTIEVSALRLDDCCSGHGYTMGKIDIEGAEPMALAGAEMMLADNNPPVWLLEVNGCLHRYGYTEAGFRDWLRERSYRMALYDPANRTLEFPDRPWEYRPNVLAISQNRMRHVHERLSDQVKS